MQARPASPLSRLLAFAVPGFGEGLGAAMWILFAARVLNVFALSSAMPFLARHLAEDRGLAATAVGAIYMAQGIAGSLFQLVGGTLSDRWSRRRLVVVSLVPRAALSLVLGACVHLHAPVWNIALCIVLNAILAGLSLPATDGLVVDHAPADKRIAAFAHQRVAVNIGWALGPLVGGLVSSRLAYAAMFAGAAPLILAGAAVLSRLPDAAIVAREKKDAHPLKALRGPLADPGLRAHLVAAFFTYVLASQLIVTLSLDASRRLGLAESELGLIWAVNGALVVFLQMPAAGLVKRIGMQTSLVGGALLYAVSYTAVGFTHALAPLLVCVVFITLAELLNAPSQQSAVSMRARPSELGASLGLLGLVTMLGRSLGPIVGGAAHDAYPDSAIVMWSLLGALGVVAAALYVTAARATRAEVATVDGTEAPRA